MNFDNYFEYNENENFQMSYKLKTFVTFIGEGNNNFLNKLLFKSNHNNIMYSFSKIKKNDKKYKKEVQFILNKHLNVFLGETVFLDLAYSMERLGFTKKDMIKKINDMAESFKIKNILKKDPNSLNINDKVKVKLMSSLLCNPKILVIEEILNELDKNEKNYIFQILRNYVNEGNIIFNFTSDIEDAIYSDEIVVLSNDKILLKGSTLGVLNQDKILNKLGIGLPFIVELNKYLIDYGIIKNYELDMNKLVGVLWK